MGRISTLSSHWDVVNLSVSVLWMSSGVDFMLWEGVSCAPLRRQRILCSGRDYRFPTLLYMFSRSSSSNLRGLCRHRRPSHFPSNHYSSKPTCWISSAFSYMFSRSSSSNQRGLCRHCQLSHFPSNHYPLFRQTFLLDLFCLCPVHSFGTIR